MPKPLRGLFLRERRLLGLLSRCAFETVRRCFGALLRYGTGRPGMVASIQTFGSQGQWNPHLHALVTDGLLKRGGAFLPMRLWSEETERLLTETFRLLLLDRLVKEDRLSEDFRERLLTFRHGGGFSVYGRHLVLTAEPARLAHLARYLVRAPVAAHRVHESEDGAVLLEIPPDPRTRSTVLAFDPLEWIRRMTNQIPDRCRHLVRYYGAYANRLRRLYRAEDGEAVVHEEESGAVSSPGRASWARLLRLIFEVDPLTCQRCGAEMKVISVITDPALVARLLRHVKSRHAGEPFDARAPPAA